MPKEIRVTQHFNQYNPGEIATFPDAVAQDIIDRRLGREVRRDRKGDIIDDPVTNAAEKPVGGMAEEGTRQLFAALRQSLPPERYQAILALSGQAVLAWQQARRPAS